MADSAGGGAAQVANPDTFVIDGDDDTGGITQSDDVVLNSGNTNTNNNANNEADQNSEDESVTPPNENILQETSGSKGSDTTNNVANEIIGEVEQIAPPSVELPTPPAPSVELPTPPPPPAPVWDGRWSTDPLLTTPPYGGDPVVLTQTIDPYLDWGLYVEDGSLLGGATPAPDKIRGGYINGAITDPSVVQGMITGGTIVTYGATAGGFVIDGAIKYSDGTFDRINTTTDQNFNLNIDFSDPTNALSGIMWFKNVAGAHHWTLRISGGVTPDGFSGDLTEDMSHIITGAGAGSTGTLRGNFYGSGAETVGGKFKIISTGGYIGATVDGMFIGKR
ncbi:hypothetical protein AGMMS50229_19190 [Campylobacterota bacterium]|nr:hypothetical protein AGMMS50229_19190 [Campylobacterota bacterium]